MTRLAWLDALRGWAAAVVAVFHLSPVVLGRELHLRIFDVIDLGKYGVLLFFLVSGYVIPMSLERHGDLRRFWVGRLLRIYPAYLLAVLIAIGLGAAGIMRMPDQLAGETVASVLGHMTMLQDLIGTRGVLRPFWTLSFEMVFYLVVAGLYAWGWHRLSAWWAAGLTVVATVGGARLPADLLGGSPGARRITAVVAVALSGAVLWAYLCGRRRLALAAGTGGLAVTILPLVNGHATDQVTSASSAQAAQMLAVMFAGTVIYRAQHREAGRPAAVAVLALVAGGVATQTTPAVAVAVAATFATAFLVRRRRVPGVLVRLGAISYSLYLLHLPVLAVIRHVTQEPLVTAVAFAAGSLAAAWAGHRWVERPVQALARAASVITAPAPGSGARPGGVTDRVTV
jgi:peptidoglycan/LPS O-acetylase OafA/YrhL